MADAAAEEWEEAISAYNTRLQVIRKALPRAARHLLSRVTLHDAMVLAIALTKKQPRLTILIQLEGTPSRPGDMLELTYRLVAGGHGGVTFGKHTSLKAGASGLGWILYDEFDVDEQRSFFTHSLLLTGGHEIEIRFHTLRVRRLDELLLPPLELQEGERTWPLVGA